MPIALPSAKWLLVAFFLIPSVMIHFRGKVRLKFLRQIGNHSTLLAPLNVLLYRYSDVPNTAFLDVASFPELQQLKENWQTIRAEAMALHESGVLEATGKQGDISYQSFVKRGWRRFFIKWYDSEPQYSAKQYCPQTIALLKKLPSVKAAMFACLPAGGKLTAHRDPYAGSLRYQLGLRTPNSDDCTIIVDGKPYSWRDGEDVLFDETFVHNAYNKTDIDRLVLFCDVERPVTKRWLRRFNRWFASTVIASANAKNNESDSVGLLNRLMPKANEMATRLQQFKKEHRVVFQSTKYLLLILVVFWLLGVI